MFKLPLVLLALVSLLFWLHSSQAGGPHLLISKVILNEYTVEGKDLTIQYSLYNVGEGAAQSVTLEDSTFPPEEFTLVQGLLTVQWDKIAPNSNVSHLVIMKPNAAGFYNVSWAKVTYSSADNNEQVAYSSAPGVIQIIPYPDFSRKHESHLVDWLAFVTMSAPTVLLPLFLWYRSHSKYENLKVKKA